MIFVMNFIHARRKNISIYYFVCDILFIYLLQYYSVLFIKD